MITKPLRILLIEDEITDAALIQRQVHKCVQDCQMKVTDNLISFRHALKTFIPDIVFTDYDLVSFTGIDVIENMKEIYPNVPIIIITGTLNDEELAANSITKGASGYLLKNDINNLHKKLQPMIEDLLASQARLFAKLEKERREREQLQKIHAILKNAASVKDEDYKTKHYYEKLLAEISDNLPSILK